MGVESFKSGSEQNPAEFFKFFKGGMGYEYDRLAKPEIEKMPLAPEGKKFRKRVSKNINS